MEADEESPFADENKEPLTQAMLLPEWIWHGRKVQGSGDQSADGSLVYWFVGIALIAAVFPTAYCLIGRSGAVGK